MIIYCSECRDEVQYSVKKEIKSMDTDTKKFGFLSFKWEEKTPICDSCGNPVYVASIEKANNKQFKQAVKEAQLKNLNGDEAKWQQLMNDSKNH